MKIEQLKMSFFPVLILCSMMYTTVAQELVYIGSKSMDSPGFVALFNHELEDESTFGNYSIIVSTFALEPGTTEEVELLLFPGTCLIAPDQCGNLTVARGLNWPRQAAQLPGM